MPNWYWENIMDKGPLNGPKQSCQTHIHTVAGYNWWIDPGDQEIMNHRSSTRKHTHTGRAHTHTHTIDSIERVNREKKFRIMRERPPRSDKKRIAGELNDRTIFLWAYFYTESPPLKWLRCQTISIRLTNPKRTSYIAFSMETDIVRVGVVWLDIVLCLR